MSATAFLMITHKNTFKCMMPKLACWVKQIFSGINSSFLEKKGNFRDSLILGNQNCREFQSQQK